MTRTCLAALSLLACLPASAAPEAMRFTSQQAALPAGDAIFPGGAAAEAVNNTCLACHSAGMVLTQPHLTRAEWQAEVTKMVNVYKASVDKADEQAIVDYLAAMKPQP